MTTSARRPGARLPISPPMPIASAGREVIIASASPQLTPGRAGNLLQADEVAGILALHEQVAGVVVVDHADRDFDAGRRIRPTFDWVAAICSKRRRQVVDRRGDHRNARAGDPVGDRASLRSRRPARSSAPGNSRLRSRTCRMSLARSTWTSRYCRPCSTGTSAAASNRVSSTSSLRRASVRRRAIRWDCGPPGGRAHRVPALTAERRAHSGGARPLRARHCGTGRGRKSASRPPLPRRSRRARRTGISAAAVIGSMSAPVSITAPCPAKMLLPARRRDQRARDTVGAIDRDGRVERVDRRNDVDRRVERAVRGRVVGCSGRVVATAAIFLAAVRSTSARPSREKPATIPGVTHLPVASITCVPAGSFIRISPAATIRPSRTTTMPFGIGSRAVAERDGAADDREGLRPTRGTATAASSAARAARIISCLPRPAGRARSR